MKQAASVRTRLVATAALLVIMVGGLALALSSNRSLEGQSAPAQMMTIDPRIVANLTALPKATALSGADANDLTALRSAAQACADYTSARRDQMIEQIDFILDPSKLPPDVIIALGTNPRGRLLTAIGTVTANQWRLNNKPANSCLVPIGKRINQLLVAEGETPIAVFETGG